MNSHASAPETSDRAARSRPDRTDTVRVVCASCATTNRLPLARLAEAARCGSCNKPLLEGRAFELSKKTFEHHIGATDLPLVVDFREPWCGPCRTMAPTYEQAAARLAPRVRLAKLNTEDEPAIAARFGIRSIPTLIAFKNGREVARQSGTVDLPRLMRWISDNV